MHQKLSKKTVVLVFLSFFMIEAYISMSWAIQEIQFNSTDEDCGAPVVQAVRLHGHIMKARDRQESDRRMRVNVSGDVIGWRDDFKGPMSAWVHDELCHEIPYSQRLNQSLPMVRVDYMVDSIWRSANIPASSAGAKVWCVINASNFGLKIMWIG